MDSTVDPKVKWTTRWSWMETLTLRLTDGDPTVQLLLSLGRSDSSHGLGK